MKSIITLSDEYTWTNYVNRSAQHDFYHTAAYHAAGTEGIPLLFVYEENENFIALPLMKRQISNSGYFDLTSVYGYPGPISNKDWAMMDKSIIQGFQASFLEFLAEEKYVSVFTRLNPLFEQVKAIEQLGGVYYNGITVPIDLSTTLEEQTARYRKSFRVSIKKQIEQGRYVKEESSGEAVAAFVSIYTENMDRIGACPYYYFTEKYFNDLLHSTDFDCRLLLVYDEGKPISGAIISLTNGIIQMHLLATRTKYLSESPAKLVVHEATRLGRELNMKYCHLGGGLGFKEDALFHWKCGFSNLRLPYYSWRFIANETIYNAMLHELRLSNEENIDFFPLYRYTAPSTNNAVKAEELAVSEG